jgi:hypothetical protein
MMHRGDVTDFMTEHAGQFRLVIDEREQTASYVDVAARDSDRVDDRGVQNGEGIDDALALALRRDFLPDLVHVGLQCRIVVGAAERLQYFRMLLTAGLFLAGIGGQTNGDVPAGGRIGGASGDKRDGAGETSSQGRTSAEGAAESPGKQSFQTHRIGPCLQNHATLYPVDAADRPGHRRERRAAARDTPTGSSRHGFTRRERRYEAGCRASGNEKARPGRG